MSKWRLLLLIVLCWTGLGLAIDRLRQETNTRSSASPRKIDRIVSMAPNLTEILFELGLQDKVVAVSNDSDYPVGAAQKIKVGTFWQPNLEAAIAARPDLVITLGFGQQKTLAQRLRRIGYETLTVNIEKVPELFEAIEKIGGVTNTSAQAACLVTEIRQKLQSLSSLVEKKEKVKVLFVVQREPLRVAGRDTFINEMIAMAGGENAIGHTIHKYPPIGAEQVIACRPDVIIEPVMGPGRRRLQQAAAVKYWSRFKDLPAVTNERICVIDGDVVSRLGPRLYDGTETIARCLRPELLAN